MHCRWWLGWCGILLLAAPVRAEYPFAFRDVGAERGVLPAAAGIRGHGVGWGDVDGDGWIDLYIATFHNDGSPANLFFRNKNGKFEQDTQPSLKISARGTGVLFADLDNDGDLDLYLGSMPAPAGSRLAEKEGHPMLGNQLLRNEGGGKFTNISEGNGACPLAFGGRSITVLDYDGDGLLDLLSGEEPVSGYNGSPTKSSRLFHNLGGLKFEDVSRQVGLTEGVAGLGVAAADVNGDTWPDFFLSATGANVMFINDGHGKFREAPRAVFAWPTAKGDNMCCGVAFCDINRDGRQDMVLGQHYSSPWKDPITNHVYLHRGLKDGLPEYEDITEKIGIGPLPLKSPHVEFQDFDNDGWPDLYADLVKFAGGKPYPLIYKNLGVKDGLPQLREETLAVNDFPTAEDRAIGRSGTMFEKILKEGKIIYMAPGPTGDFDNDGRLDMFLANWWIEAPSLLLKNETKGGHWLDVQVVGPAGVNRMGIGTRIS